MQSTANKPLSGVRVVECGVWHAGPGASAILADLGAEVIKVESLDGDPERNFGYFRHPDDTAANSKENWTRLFEMSNRGKKGVAIDIATDAGYVLLVELTKSADIFLTNLRSSTVDKLKISYADLSLINPRLIHLYVNGFGSLGPMRNAGGFDPLGQAMSGMMFMADPKEPALLDVVPLDQMAAITASHAALTALYAREQTGRGEELSVSLYGSALWLQYVGLFAAGLFDGGVRNYGSRKESPALSTSYQCGDGQWIMACSNPEEKYWTPFCTTLGAEDLLLDEKYATKEGRATGNGALIDRFDEVFARKSREEWLHITQEAGLLFAPIRQIGEVLDDEQAVANGYVKDVDHPLLGSIKVPGYPVRFGSMEVGTTMPAPGLGEHTVEVLQDLGLTPHQVQTLTARGVIKDMSFSSPQASTLASVR